MVFSRLWAAFKREIGFGDVVTAKVTDFSYTRRGTWYPDEVTVMRGLTDGGTAKYFGVADIIPIHAGQTVRYREGTRFAWDERREYATAAEFQVLD